MKKAKLLPVVFIIAMLAMLLFFADRWLRLEYNMGLLAYIQGESWLTDSEKAYLANLGDLTYGADQSSPPLRYVNAQTGQYEGLVIDYLSALSMELGINIKTKPLVWQDALDQLAKGKTDLCDMYASKTRRQYYAFTSPIYMQRGAILVKRGENSIISPNNLEGKKVAGIRGDYVFEYLKNQAMSVMAYPTEDTRTAIHLLETGQVSAVLGDEAVLSYYLSTEGLGSDYAILDDYLYELEAVFGVPKSKAALVPILNKAIYRLNRQSAMDRIYEKWYQKRPLITKSSQTEHWPIILQLVVTGAGMMALGLFYWNRQLSLAVRRQTHALSESHRELELAFKEYRLAESRMLQSSKMAAIGQLAAGIAHEIRTPLGIIRNSSYLLKKQANGTDGNQIKHIQTIEQSVDRANRIIDSLLNVSRVGDKQPVAIEPRTFVESLWTLHAKVWQTQGITFDCDYNVEKQLLLPEEPLKHILINLFANAVDAMPKGGHIATTMLYDRVLSQLQIVVRDTGSGIASNELDKLFDPFYTTKPPGKGTGLGLYIVYNEVEKLGGHIEVTSEVGKGTTMWLTIPTKEVTHETI